MRQIIVSLFVFNGTKSDKNKAKTICHVNTPTNGCHTNSIPSIMAVLCKSIYSDSKSLAL